MLSLKWLPCKQAGRRFSGTRFSITWDSMSAPAPSQVLIQESLTLEGNILKVVALNFFTEIGLK